MALGIFIGGMFLGFILGFTIMALLAAERLSSKPKRRREGGVIFPVTSPPASLGLRWRTGQRPSEIGSS
jgi:hypothetical protein